MTSADHLRKFVTEIRDGKVLLGGGRVATTNDMQVLTATNSGTPISKDELNTMLQDLLNKRESNHSIYRVGDRVMCTRNSLYEHDDKTNLQYVANGEQGTVVRAEVKFIVVSMEQSPDVRLVIPTGTGKGDFDLAYAVTVHKAQGSQWPITCVMLGGDFKSKMVVGHEWFYTAISRCEDRCVVFGTTDTVRAACATKRIWDRKTFSLDWYSEATSVVRAV
jgi:exodeoxyribonuclease V alpha subunit